MIAVLPAAGRGARMRSVAEGSKEMLDLCGRPVIDWVLEEGTQAGCGEAVIVSSSLKEDINAFAARAGLRVAFQDEPRGLADAVLIGAGLQPALVLLPDTIFHPASPSSRLVHAVSRGYDFAVAVEPVGEDRVSNYGIAEWNPESGRISRILEKPAPTETASRYAVAARFALSARTLYFLRESFPSSPDGEIHLTPLLNGAVRAGHIGLAVPLETDEHRLDCGSPEGYQRACEVVGAGL